MAFDESSVHVRQELQSLLEKVKPVNESMSDSGHQGAKRQRQEDSKPLCVTDDDADDTVNESHANENKNLKTTQRLSWYLHLLSSHVTSAIHFCYHYSFWRDHLTN